MSRDEVDRNKAGKPIGRRDFLKSASIAAAALALPSAFGPFAIITRRAGAQTDEVEVIISRDGNTASGAVIVTDYVQLITDEAIRRLTGILDVGEAYKSIFPDITPEHVIGIKVNCINAYLPTHPEVVDALIRGLTKMDFGGTPFPENNIIIWDRSSDELQFAGYALNTGNTGVRCFGTDEVGYNTAVDLNCAGSIQHPSRILTDYIDYHIDFAVLKNAGEAGLTLTLKNNFGCIDQPGELHDNNCNPGIPSVNQQIRDELDVTEALFLVDAVFGASSGGVMAPPNMEYNGILMGFDRVAVDSIGRSILEEYGCPTLASATHVDTAAQPPYNLGTSNLAEIHRIDVFNPSNPVSDLQIITRNGDALLTWSSPDYTGCYKVLRSPDASFTRIELLATLTENQYVDPNAIGTGHKYFYRVVKTW